MTVELNKEDQAAAEALVAEGRFSSVGEAVHVAIQLLHETDDWKDYARDRIASGLEDIAAGRTVPVEDVFEMLRNSRQQKA